MDRHFAVAYTAIQQRRHALAAEALFGAGHRDSMVQPGIEEALACRDMLHPAPAQPSRTARLIARLRASFRVIAHRELVDEYQPAPATPHVTP